MKRHFLDWTRPVAEAAAAFLLATVRGQPLDLSQNLVVVPTRQAARRLRERLAIAARDRGTMVLSPLLVQPEYFVRPQQVIANKAESLATLVAVLATLDYAEYEHVFPVHAAQQARSFQWRLETAALLLDLRHMLAENGLTLATAAAKLLADGTLPAPEPERWQQLARLEAAYTDTLHKNDLGDPVAAQIHAARHPAVPAHIRRLVILAVPDPVPLAIQAWTELERQGVSIDVCVHGTEADAAFFDDWGRPRTDNWGACALNLPDACIHLVPKPPDQAAMATRLLRQALAATATAQPPEPAGILAMGVLDDEVLPHLEAAMAEAGVLPFNPALMFIEQHALYHFVRDLLNLTTQGAYDNFRSLLRNPALLQYFERQPEAVDSFALLRETDRLQNEHLPAAFATAAQCASQRQAKTGAFVYGTALAAVCEKLQDWLHRLNGSHWPTALLDILAAVYSSPVQPRESAPEAAIPHNELAEVITALRDTLDALASPTLNSLLPAEDPRRRDLFLFLLRQQSYCRAESSEPRVALEGWLELHWNDAPVLILTGCNEGRVPAATVGLPFVPNTARRALGLPDNDARLARDSYLLTAMCAFRLQPGAITLILGKTTTAGDVLRPSRLLFRCPDDHALAHRALRLFGMPEAPIAAAPSDPGWRLRPRWQEPAAHASVSALNDYLRCPFRFYLRHVLGMRESDDRKLEMDALDFGVICHETFSRFAESAGLRDASDGEAIAAFLVGEARDILHARYGRDLSAALILQEESLLQRLRHAARCQAATRREGWRILALNGHYSEHPMTLDLDGFQIRARIDRLDFHESSGRCRIMDYKTSDKAKSPAEVHLDRADDDMPPWRLVSRGDTRKAWHNLQLPIYQLMTRAALPDRILETAYFLLPRAVTQTEIISFTELDAALLQSAETCVAGVVSAIRSRQFWPPTEINSDFDDFARLSQGDWREAFDVTDWPGAPSSEPLT